MIKPAKPTIANRVGGFFRRLGETALGYDAADQSPTRRSAPTTSLVSEDVELTRNKRARLISSGRDLVRNFTVACWMIRKHLDFVASFNFQARTGDDGFDDELESFIRFRSKKENADVRGVHPLRRLVRMSEARATLDGDLAWLKLREGAIQAIEGDRIRDPDRRRRRNLEREKWFQGVRTNAAGRPMAVAIHNRAGRGFVFDRVVDWRSIFWHAAYDTTHRFDQTRGVGPVVTAIDELRDLYEAKTYALAKQKVAQMFGLVIYSESLDGAGSHTPLGEGSDPDGDGDIDQERYQVDFGKGPLKLELDGADRAEFLEAKTAAGDTIQFLTFCIAVAMKSLDLPFSMWDEAHTNFFGSKTAITLYLQSAARKRENVRDLLDAWSAWQITRGVAEGELTLPRGLDLATLVGGSRFEWIPAGLPWFDRTREVKPAIQAIGAGLDTHSRIVRELYGARFEDLIAEAQRDQRLARNSGVALPEFSAWFDNSEGGDQ